MDQDTIIISKSAIATNRHFGIRENSSKRTSQWENHDNRTNRYVTTGLLRIQSGFTNLLELRDQIYILPRSHGAHVQ